MEHELNIWVVGGDLRQVRLAQLLANEGHTVYTYALEEQALPQGGLDRICRADCVVFPLPVSSGDGLLTAPLSLREHRLEGLLDRLSPGQFLCGGRVGPDTRALAQARALTVHDYFAREELAIANAVPTAEGAIQLAMERLPITIHGARVLVIGYGRVGRACALRFRALGAKVTAAARRCPQLALAQSDGLDGEQIGRLGGWIHSFDLVVNTVPAQILGAAELGELRPDCLVLDLASQPGGVDIQAAQALGIAAVRALSLPGKTAPVTAARAIRDTIYHMLEEQGF